MAVAALSATRSLPGRWPEAAANRARGCYIGCSSRLGLVRPRAPGLLLRRRYRPRPDVDLPMHAAVQLETGDTRSSLNSTVFGFTGRVDVAKGTCSVAARAIV